MVSYKVGMLAPMAVSTLALLPTLIGCGGDMGSYENIPGYATVLSSNRLAVDDRNDNIFWLNEQQGVVGVDEAGDDVVGVTLRGLFRLDPDTLQPRFLLELTDLAYPRLQFVGETILISGNDGQNSEWFRLRRDSLNVVDHQVLENDYSLGSAAPSGKLFLAGSWPSYDCTESEEGESCTLTSPAQVGIVDAYTAVKHELVLGENLFLARWLNNSDTLLLTIFGTDEAEETPYVRVLAYDYATLSSNAWELSDEGLWTNPRFDLRLDQIGPDLVTLFTDLSISPDDHTLALSSYRSEVVSEVQPDGTTTTTNITIPELQVIDLSAGTHQAFVDALGPVGFTPDSSTIVAYMDGLGAPQGTGEAADPLPEEETEGTQVLMIDRADLSYETLALEGVDSVQFYVTREGSFVVVDTYTYDYNEADGTSTSAEQLMVYDLDNGGYTTLSADPDLDVDLTEFISRTGHQEIWAVDGGQLFRIGYGQGTFEQVDTLEHSPNLIHYLPNRDRVFLGSIDIYNDVTFWAIDPTTQAIVSPILTTSLD